MPLPNADPAAPDPTSATTPPAPITHRPAACTNKPQRSSPRHSAEHAPSRDHDGPGDDQEGYQAHAVLDALAVGRGTRLGHGELFEKSGGLGQPRRDDLPGDLHQLEHARIADGVADGGPHLAILHDAVLPQRGQMLRRAARIEFQSGLQLAHRLLAVAQQLEDAHPGRMAQHPEEPGLHSVYGELTRHERPSGLAPSQHPLNLNAF